MSPARGGCCGSSCDCKVCFCRVNHNVESGANRAQYGNQGGAAEQAAVPSLPIDIPTSQFASVQVTASSLEEIEGPNDARQVFHGPGFALTRENIIHHTRSHEEAGSYHEEWLRQLRMETDENPFAAFLSRPSVSRTSAPTTDMFEFEQDGSFQPINHEGSMLAEGSVAGDHMSVTSRSSCPRSRSSRSTGQILAHMERTPGFVGQPLPLLGDSHLPELPECRCPKCGGEHD